MTAISIQVEGQNGLTWARWIALATEVEELGFAGLFRSDHFTNARGPELDALELIVSLTWLAANTRRIHFGSLVAPLSFRDPRMLARQAGALDDLSGGRMILGLGAGWQEREHTAFGYDLGDVPTRMARFGAGDIRGRLFPDARGKVAAEAGASWWATAADRREWRTADAAAGGALRRHLERALHTRGGLSRALGPAGRARAGGGAEAGGRAADGHAAALLRSARRG
jgi:hypothetical protein